jgi:hypothetical protein
MTVKRSSTTSQPTAMWPRCVCRSLLSAENADQNHGAGDGQRHAEDRVQPTSSIRRVREPAHPGSWLTALCATAPGIAT